MIDHLQGAGFNVTDQNKLTASPNLPDSEPDYDDYSPPVPVHEHEGEQNTRQNVTLHPKDQYDSPQGGSY